MSGKRVSNGYASLCVNWKRTRSLNGKSGGVSAPPSATFTNSLHFPALSDTVTIHNSGLSVYYNNLIFIMDFLVMIKTRFSRWLTFFYVRRCRGAGATGKKPTLRRCRQRAVVWLAKTNFMWWKMTVVLWKPSPKNITSAFSLCYRLTPGVDPYVPRAGSVLTIPLQTLLPDAPREGIVINIAELRLYYYPPGKKIR